MVAMPIRPRSRRENGERKVFVETVSRICVSCRISVFPAIQR